MRSPGPRPRAATLYEHADAAKARYERYVRETEALLADAQRAQDQGKWTDAASFLQAAAATVCAAQGCARELNLLYILAGE